LAARDLKFQKILNRGNKMGKTQKSWEEMGKLGAKGAFNFQQ
jgi:hypothetical protein